MQPESWEMTEDESSSLSAGLLFSGKLDKYTVSEARPLIHKAVAEAAQRKLILDMEPVLHMAIKFIGESPAKFDNHLEAAHAIAYLNRLLAWAKEEHA